MVDSRSIRGTTFERAGDFRRWLERHHASESEIWVVDQRKRTREAEHESARIVDEALCFG
jgi:hypothetical protein